MARKKKRVNLKKRNYQHAFEVNLTSMIDMFTIILLFLLKSYSIADVNLSPPKGIQLPSSISDKVPHLAVKVDLGKGEINVDGRTVVYLRNGRLRQNDIRGLVILPLFDELNAISEAKIKLAKANPDQTFKREIILFGEKTLPFSTVKQVLFTAGQARFESFRFSVIRKGDS